MSGNISSYGLYWNIDNYISKPESGVVVYYSRASFLRSACMEFLQKRGVDLTKKVRKEEILTV